MSAWDLCDEMKGEFRKRKDYIEELAETNQVKAIEEAFDDLDGLIGLIAMYLMQEQNPHVRTELIKLQKQMSIYQLKISQRTGVKIKLAY